MLKKLFSGMVLLTLGAWLFSAKLADCPELLTPGCIAASPERIYISDGYSVHIYSLKDFRHQKTFGRQGEGPGEFSFPPTLHLFPGEVFVNTRGKVMFFSPEGEFIRQHKLPPINNIADPVLPVGKNFVGVRIKGAGSRVEGAFRESRKIVIFNNKFESLKEIPAGSMQLPPPPAAPGSGGRVPRIDFQVIEPCREYAVYKEKIYIADTRRGFFFSVFHRDGQKLYDIDIGFRVLEVDQQYKEDYMALRKRSRFWQYDKQRFNFVFPRYFPSFFSFKISDDKIYAYTYRKKGDLFEIVVLDLKGTILNRAFAGPFAPYHRLSESSRFSDRYTIADDRIYYLVEDEENDMWQLHSREIK